MAKKAAILMKNRFYKKEMKLKRIFLEVSFYTLNDKINNIIVWNQK